LQVSGCVPMPWMMAIASFMNILPWLRAAQPNG
jgi:hypothetical protein